MAVAGLTDKQKIMAVHCGTLTGDFLPSQVVHQGKTNRCQPTFDFPSHWHITHSPEHWSNESTMVDYIQEIIVPYISRVREDLQPSPYHPALAFYDAFKGQLTDAVTDPLEFNNILVVTVPANCTNRLQPMAISLNKDVKYFLRRKFQVWCSEKLNVQLIQELEGDPINLMSATTKTERAKWLVRMFEHMQQNPSLIVSGFIHAGIPQALDNIDV